MGKPSSSSHFWIFIVVHNHQRPSYVLSLCINPKSFVIMCICVFFMAKKIVYNWNYGRSWWKCINYPSYVCLFISDVENVNLQHSLHLTNVSSVDVVQLAIVQVQIVFGKSYVIECLFVHMVFLFLNDNLLVDWWILKCYDTLFVDQSKQLSML
jgi:hypothetical protein